MAYTNPTVADFKAYWVRDFPYQPGSPTPVDLNLYIQDADIQKAIDLVALIINDELFSSQSFYSIMFEYLAAHNLCLDIKNGGQGTSGIYDWIMSNKSVGNVSAGFTVPDYILKNPMFAMLSKTPYGAKYLEIMLPYFVGPMFTVCGRTLP